jgi:hypothetical protein
MSSEFTSHAIQKVKEDVDITSLSEIYFAELVVKQLKESKQDKTGFANMEKIGSHLYALNIIIYCIHRISFVYIIYQKISL